ncbi:excalibur calcium-binding domain-containing protein [Candidatus Kaiserbacteria bacterium]|nr:excalibur calcium-binding domain-containing protein [Candidatus Kaiserbacteria bacterium]
MEHTEQTPTPAPKPKVADWRKSKKVRLYIIIGLIAVVAIIAFFVESLRWWMLGIGTVLLIALGLEASNTDVDLNSVMQGNSVSDSVIERDADGNLKSTTDGSFMTKIWRDQNGDVVPEGTVGAKAEDQYNCDDFKTQAEAQVFFDNAGGVANDVNRLDGNKDGVPCQALPAS